MCRTADEHLCALLYPQTKFEGDILESSYSWFIGLAGQIICAIFDGLQ